MVSFSVSARGKFNSFLVFGLDWLSWACRKVIAGNFFLDYFVCLCNIFVIFDGDVDMNIDMEGKGRKFSL